MSGEHGGDAHYSTDELKLILRGRRLSGASTTPDTLGISSSHADSSYNADEWNTIAHSLDFSRMTVSDLDAPEALTRYAEGQRIVGAYVLTTVHDDGAPGGPADVPVYVTVMSPYKAGLTYDFDQVRVFTWSLNHHRYETGFRNKNIEGYLPVVVGKAKDPAEKGVMGQEELPVFTYRVLAADAPAVVPDPVTGEMKPGKTVAKTLRLEGNLVRRVGGSAGAPWAQGAEMEAHPVVEEKKGKKGRK